MTDNEKLNQDAQLNDAELEGVDGGRGQRYAYYTVVHGYIEIQKPFCKIIDSPEFQRLKWIEQGSFRVLYPAARHVILDSLGKLVTTGEGANDAAGPVGVVQMVAQQTQSGGLEIFLNLVVIISINLGLINLLPIPGLDGSRLVFMLIEAIRRKPVNRRIESTVHLIGYALLLGLMVFFTFRDVSRILGG